MSGKQASGNGIGFVGLLTIVFITLKLLGQIDWPWIWVLSPLWIWFAIFLAFLLLGILIITVIKRW